MKRILRNIRLNIGSIASFGALFGVLWLFFAPIQLGGSVTYVMIDGNSMEPSYHEGDLVIARKQNSYKIEDVIVYEHPNIGPVFHRIVDQKGEQFVLKGDHNSWLDTYKPTTNDIFGKLWLHISSGGSVIKTLRDPRYLALFSILIAGLVVVIVFNKKTILSKHQRRKYMKRKKRVTPSDTGSPESRLEILLVLGVFILLALLLGAFAFTKPAKLQVADDIQYRHTGNLTYTAVDTGDVYDAEQIQSGEPVFLELACDVNMRYEYELDILLVEQAPTESFQGTARISAKVTDPNGWNRTLQLLPQTSFSGQKLIVKTGLNLCEMRELITHMEEATGVGNQWYNLIITPEIFIQGKVMGEELHDTFAPAISFQLDSLLMRIISDAENNPLTTTEIGILPRFRQETNELTVLGVEMPVIIARLISAGMFILSLMLGLWFGLPVYHDWQKGDATRIKIQYSPLLIDIREENLTSGDNHFVEVISFQELSKLAERYGAVILHEEQGLFHRYLVQDGNTVYQYALDGADPEAAFPNFSEFRRALRQAIIGQELQLYYQSIVSLETEKSIGVEALLRWTHPTYGIIYPSEFITRAEESDLIQEIDNWVLEQACRQAREWQEMEIPFGKLSVNVSAYRFANPMFINWFMGVIEKTGCAPHHLQVEINRANIVSKDEVALANVHKLHEMGVLLAVDNFAAAEANQIDYLSQMPVHCLKIDRSIVQNPQNNYLVNAVVNIAKSLNLMVTAQGVETEEQIMFLKESQVDACQGYFLSRLVQANEIATFFDNSHFLPDAATEE
ncbi:MAG: signal peptidase I [Chloroflexota bacterium]|nr:MAG: signal peptidase I [Chloroflexota bacterium]